MLRQCLTGGSCNTLYLKSEKKGLEGVISFSDIREFVFEEGLRGLVMARDLANQIPSSPFPGEPESRSRGVS